MSEPELVALWDAIDKWARSRYRPGEKNVSRAEKAVVEVQDCARVWANAAERAAHEETRRRLEAQAVSNEEAHELQDILHTLTNSGTALKTSARELVAALEQARRELAEAREEIECDGGSKLARIRELEAALRENDENVAEIESALQAAEREAAQLASLLSCEPGEVVERVKALREALDSLVMACELPGQHCEVEQALPAARAALQPPSRPASEPADYTLDSPDSKPKELEAFAARGFKRINRHAAPPASVAEQAQGRCQEVVVSRWLDGLLHTHACWNPLPCAAHPKPAKPSEGDRDD